MRVCVSVCLAAVSGLLGGKRSPQGDTEVCPMYAYGCVPLWEVCVACCCQGECPLLWVISAVPVSLLLSCCELLLSCISFLVIVLLGGDWVPWTWSAWVCVKSEKSRTTSVQGGMDVTGITRYCQLHCWVINRFALLISILCLYSHQWCVMLAWIVLWRRDVSVFRAPVPYCNL